MSTIQITLARVEQLKLSAKVARLHKAEAAAAAAAAALAKKRQTRDEQRAALITAGLSKSDVARLLDISIPAVVNSITRAEERATND